MHKVWIEVALNGAWNRKLQPLLPDTVETIVAEGIACARAGASIIHTHAFEDGTHTFDWQVYARIIEGIRAKVDVPVYPSYPAIPATGMSPAERFAHVEALAERGLIDFAVVDPGSVNFTMTTATATTKPAFTCFNPEVHVRYALDFAARKGFHPAFAIYEPGSRVRALRSRGLPASRRRSTVSCSPTSSPSTFRRGSMRWQPISRCSKKKPALRRG